MKALKFLKQRILYPACLYTILLSGTVLLLSYATVEIPSIIASVFFGIFGYCVLLSASNLLLHIKKLNTVLKVLLHFLVNSALIFALMKLAFTVQESNRLTQTGIEARGYIVGFILFLVAYLVISVVRFTALHIIKKKEQKAAEYTSVF